MIIQLPLEIQISQYGATTFGQENQAIGSGTTISGIWNNAATPWETVVGFDNGISTSSHLPDDLVIILDDNPLFQVGNGASRTNRNNALTILRNGKVGVGIIGSEAAAKPTEAFDVGSGGVKIRSINGATYTSSVTTDKIVVADATGIRISTGSPKTLWTVGLFLRSSSSSMQGRSSAIKEAV